MSIVLSDLAERLGTLTKLVLAEPVARIGHSRITVRPLTLRGKAFFQLEYQQGQKVSHRNVARGALLETFDQELDGLFRSVTLCTETETRQYVRKANGAYKCTAKSGASRAAAASHNRKKEYILQEGENIPALVDLGVFTPEFKIVKAKYDKYKQINRFIELVDDAFRSYGRDEITILDFGCGKSYLTFVLYYYFAVKRGVRAKIIGYDLKEDVVAHCNEVAARYGYEGLRFVVADVTRDVLYDEHIARHPPRLRHRDRLRPALRHLARRGAHLLRPLLPARGQQDHSKGRRLQHSPLSRTVSGAFFGAPDRRHPRRRSGGRGLRRRRHRVHRLCPLAEKPDAALPPHGKARHKKARRIPPSPRPIRLRANPIVARTKG